MIIIIVTVIVQKKKSDRWRWSNDGDANESFLMQTLTCCCNWKEFLRQFKRDSDNEIQVIFQGPTKSTLRKSVKTTSKHSVKKSFKKKEVTFSEEEREAIFNESDPSLVKYHNNR